MRGPVPILLIFLALAAAVIGYRYQQYILRGNYLVNATISCDPQVEQCFVTDCSPEEDPDCDTSTYKKVEITAAEAPACLVENSCESFSCSSSSCRITTCSEESLEEGELCASPK